MRFLDTNVLVRHLSGDPLESAARATAFLQREPELFVHDLIFAETVYVLRSFYQVPRPQLIMTMRSLLALASVTFESTPRLVRALELFEIERLDFAEAYLVARAEEDGSGSVVSFDRAIDRARTVTRIEP